MKNLDYSTTNRNNGVNNTTKDSNPYDVIQNNRFNYSNTRLQVTKETLLTQDAYIQMAAGLIPDLWDACRDLYSTFFENHSPFSALKFVPVMQRLQAIEKTQFQHFIKNRETRHVLVDNKLITVVLIHWKPGKVSSIHGHPKGGCVFKVLQGKLEELRYSADTTQNLLSSNGYRSGSIAYIDDKLGYHAVGNPFGSSAISLHAYTPGKYNK